MADIVNNTQLPFWESTRHITFDIVNKKGMMDLFAISRFECTFNLPWEQCPETSWFQRENDIHCCRLSTSYPWKKFEEKKLVKLNVMKSIKFEKKIVKLQYHFSSMLNPQLSSILFKASSRVGNGSCSSFSSLNSLTPLEYSKWWWIYKSIENYKKKADLFLL